MFVGLIVESLESPGLRLRADRVEKLLCNVKIDVKIDVRLWIRFAALLDRIGRLLDKAEDILASEEDLSGRRLGQPNRL